MIKINPFKAVRPVQDKVGLVATRSYLSYSPVTLREKLLNNPYTFLHIINPEFSVKSNFLKDVNRYKLVRQKYLDFCEDGIFFHVTKLRFRSSPCSKSDLLELYSSISSCSEGSILSFGALSWVTCIASIVYFVFFLMNSDLISFSVTIMFWLRYCGSLKFGM